MKRQGLFLAIICAVSCSAVFAKPSEQARGEVGLTIYGGGFAVVRESRQMLFERGLNTVKFTDVASAIDPTSVSLRCISAPDSVSVLEQNFEYDLSSTSNLLRRYVGKIVSVVLKGSGADSGREVTGMLLANTGNNLILKGEKNTIEILDRSSVEAISLKELPEDLATKPTLVWLVESKDKGSKLCEVSYTTERIKWTADYSAVLGGDETQIDFGGWVTIDNKSGATYKDADVKLVAGDVRRVVKARPIYREGRLGMAAAAAPAAAFETKPFVEYHLYTLGRKSTIKDNQVKQIEFLRPTLVAGIEKLYIYDHSRQNKKVQIKLEFKNSKENNLGVALPKGKVRVYKKDPADGMLQFVGEDEIDHTPSKAKVSLYIGNAFDIAPEYTLLDTKRSRRTLEQTHKVELQNRKDKSVTVFVDEKFPTHVEWTIDKSTHEYEKRDAYTARFKVKLGPDSVSTIQYTATQRW